MKNLIPIAKDYCIFLLSEPTALYLLTQISISNTYFYQCWSFRFSMLTLVEIASVITDRWWLTQPLSPEWKPTHSFVSSGCGFFSLNRALKVKNLFCLLAFMNWSSFSKCSGYRRRPSAYLRLLNRGNKMCFTL